MGAGRGEAKPAAERVNRTIVSNTGPILHLREAQSLHLLHTFGPVLIPLAVDAELALNDENWPATQPTWVQVSGLDPAHAVHATSWRTRRRIHVGEAEAMALARQVDADWFLTDDAAAISLARELDLEAHGSLGIVVLAFALRRIEQREADGIVRRLAESSLWISNRVLERTRLALERLATN